jgi:outer membrane protein assembly factor BamB
VVGADGSIYITSPNNNAIYAFSPDGRQKWVTGGTSTVADSPAISVDGKIFVTAGPLYALGPDGTQLWYTTGFFAGASPILGADGTVYVRNSDDRLLYALSSGGQALWEAAMEPARYAPSTAPAIGGQGTAYYCASNSLTALNSVGAVQWTVFGGTPSLPGSWYANTSPAIGTDGTVYAALGSKLYAVAGTSALANSSWPMYRQNARHTGRIEKTLLSQPQKRADANVEFQLYPHQVGLTFTIESSSNLGSWSSLTSFVAMTLPMPVVDLTASNFPVRFYRAFSAQ